MLEGKGDDLQQPWNSSAKRWYQTPDEFQIRLMADLVCNFLTVGHVVTHERFIVFLFATAREGPSQPPKKIIVT